MAEIAIVGEIVNPTRNDVGGGGEGRFWTEQKITQMFDASAPSQVKSGLEMAVSATLTSPVSAGVALLKGYRVETTETNITVPDASVTYLMLQLVKDVDGNVTEAVFEINATGVPTNPDSMLIAVITSAGGAITDVRDYSPRGIVGGLTPLIFWGIVNG